MSPVPGDLWMQSFFDEEPDDGPPESGISIALSVVGVLVALAAIIAFIAFVARDLPDYDVLAPRVEEQINELYVEDVDVFVTHGRGQGFLIVVDGEQTGCTVWNAREMWEDPDLAADLRCLASEEWPFTPEPSNLPDQDVTVPSSTPDIFPDPLVELAD